MKVIRNILNILAIVLLVNAPCVAQFSEGEDEILHTNVSSRESKELGWTMALTSSKKIYASGEVIIVHLLLKNDSHESLLRYNGNPNNFISFKVTHQDMSEVAKQFFPIMQGGDPRTGKILPNESQDYSLSPSNLYDMKMPGIYIITATIKVSTTDNIPKFGEVVSNDLVVVVK